MTPLVFLHGFAGSPESFQPVAEELARRGIHPLVLCPALMGHDRAHAPGVVRFTQEVDRLAALVRARRMSGAHLCGYSLGGRVALGLLARHPQLFRSATLVSTHPGLIDPVERASRVGSDERWCALLASGGVLAFAAAWQAQPLFASQRALDAERLAAQRSIRLRHTASGLIRALRVLGLGQMPHYGGVLASYRGSVRLVVGALDDKFVQLAQSLAASREDIQVERIPAVGHNVPMEAPRALADVIVQGLEA